MNYNIQNIALIDLNSYMQKNKWIFKMNKYSFMILVVGLGITSNFIFLPNAYAYIDPGILSVVWQTIILIFASVAVAASFAWSKITSILFFFRKKKVDKKNNK